MNRQEYLLSITRKQKYICRNCGKEYLPKEADRTSYCSRECYFASGKVGRPRLRVVIVKAKPVCVVCNQAFDGKRGTKYCSDGCRKQRTKIKDFERNESRKSLKERHCEGCGKGFVSHYGDKRRSFCSVKCFKRYNSKGNNNNRKRARRYGVAYEYVNIFRVFERDGWQCQICGKSTPKKNRGSRYTNAPELDHRIPMSKGGGHLYSNVQCVCRKCNGLKSNKNEAGQLPLFEIESQRVGGFHSLGTAAR